MSAKSADCTILPKADLRDPSKLAKIGRPNRSLVKAELQLVARTPPSDLRAMGFAQMGVRCWEQKNVNQFS